MFGYTWATFHAAVNDLPAALLLAAVLFDLAGWALRRETLRATGFWTLWAGVVGGWAAFVAGRMAEDSIDHGEAIHALMQRHERLALYTMIVFSALLVWRLWRRGRLSPLEDTVARLAAIGGLALLVLTASVGARSTYRHGAGMTNDDLMAEMRDRGLTPPADSAAPAAADSATAAPKAGGHTHAPGTPEH